MKEPKSSIIKYVGKNPGVIVSDIKEEFEMKSLQLASKHIRQLSKMELLEIELMGRRKNISLSKAGKLIAQML